MGAFAIALAAYCAKSGEPAVPHEYLAKLSVSLRCDGSAEFLALIQQAIESVQNNCETEQFAAELGLSEGVSGYVYHCVPVVIHFTRRCRRNDHIDGNPDFARCCRMPSTSAPTSVSISPHISRMS